MSPGVVIVEFASVADKRKVFRARGKLADCEARAEGLRTQWEAENLYIKEGKG